MKCYFCQLEISSEQRPRLAYSTPTYSTPTYSTPIQRICYHCCLNKCVFCDRQFSTKAELTAHLPSHPPTNTIAIGQVIGQTCPFCQHDFGGNWHLMRHLTATHTSCAVHYQNSHVD